MASRLATRAFRVLLFVVVVVVGEMGGFTSSSSISISGGCKFPAVFNFGDSNSDTGSFSAVFQGIQLPYGMSSNLKTRGTDGQLIIDFITENLGLPYLDSPLDTLGRMNYRHGANFAVGGSGISSKLIHGMTIPLYLDVQVSQFFLFKSRSIALHNKKLHNSAGNNNPPLENNLPEPEVFSKALYTFDIGQNDIYFKLYNASLPTIVREFSMSLERLLRDGAKYIWVHNTGPGGCLPASINGCSSTPKDEADQCSLDKDGCTSKRNMVCQDFNKRLKKAIYSLRAKYPQAAITYVDVYSAKHLLITNANKYGFQDPFGFCCGTKSVYCSSRSINQTILAPVCTDPSKYVSWDGIHYTQAANRVVAKLIVNGSFSDPPLPIAEACNRL